jgi:hypothetical protein
MIPKITAHILILLFIALFSFESIEFFCGESFEHQETISGILELDEEGGNFRRIQRRKRRRYKI